MKRFLNITSVETKATLQERMIEKFVQQNLPRKILTRDKLSGMGDFADTNKEIECCAAELPVNGTVEILFVVKNVEVIRRINHPVTSRFIVFCTREQDNDYKVAWSCSLS
jgi:hypothetical protein